MSTSWQEACAFQAEKLSDRDLCWHIEALAVFHEEAKRDWWAAIRLRETGRSKKVQPHELEAKKRMEMIFEARVLLRAEVSRRFPL